MSKTAFTPGPWFIFGNGHCVGGPHDENGIGGIAMCGMRLRTEDEVAANTRLIAAAPALYAFARSLPNNPIVPDSVADCAAALVRDVEGVTA